MNFFYIIILIVVFFIQCREDLKSKYNTLYLEYDNKYFNTYIIESPIIIDLLNQVPIKVTQISNSNETISIILDKTINYIGQEKLGIIKKGDIYSDGDHLLFYYGDSNSTNTNNNSFFIGNVREIDDLIQLFIKKPLKYLYFRIECISSIFDNDIAYISKENPSFYILIRNGLELDNMPNLYFGSNNEPLNPHCEINKEKKYEIKCKFSEDEIKKYYFQYINNLTLFEVISGCDEKIITGYNITFIYDISHCQIQNKDTHRCSLCKNNKQFNLNNGKECVYSSFFFYMVIGLPILNIFFICLLIFIILDLFCKEVGSKFLESFTLMSILVILNIISFCLYFQKK